MEGYLTEEMEGYHPEVQCDGSGQLPIVGTRFHRTGHDFDLCLAEYAKLPEAEKAQFEAIEPPAYRRKTGAAAEGGEGGGGGKRGRVLVVDDLSCGLLPVLLGRDGHEVRVSVSVSVRVRVRVRVRVSRWPRGRSPTPNLTPNPTPNLTPNPTPNPTSNPTPNPTPNPNPDPDPDPDPNPYPTLTQPLPQPNPPTPSRAPTPSRSTCYVRMLP